MAKKYLYLFSEGNASMRELLGGKGANLAEMTNIGLPVPQGFTISTEACTTFSLSAFCSFINAKICAILFAALYLCISLIRNFTTYHFLLLYL